MRISWWKWLSSYLLLALGNQNKLNAQDILIISEPVPLVRILNFKSIHVIDRNIEIWLPPGYDSSADRRYPVLYWQDGQNLFDSTVAYNSYPLELDKAILSLLDSNKIEECIVVGIWNTDLRYREYNPYKVYDHLSLSLKRKIKTEYQGVPISDPYLKFIVDELKPYVDSSYRTNSEKEFTTIGGTSMGGLISWYAAMEYPDIFGSAICVSTHWPISVKQNRAEVINAYIKYIEERNLPLDSIRFYFDQGTENIDAWYKFYQDQVDVKMNQFQPKEYISKVFPGHTHSETSWRERLKEILPFLSKVK